jgi:hypothetical protein
MVGQAADFSERAGCEWKGALQNQQSSTIYRKQKWKCEEHKLTNTVCHVTLALRQGSTFAIEFDAAVARTNLAFALREARFAVLRIARLNVPSQ